MTEPFEGTHVQAFSEHAKDDPSVFRLTVLIWSLPSEVVQELADRLRDETTKFLTEKELGNGQWTDLAKSRQLH